MEATKDRTENLQLQAGWACREWVECVAEILGLLDQVPILEKMGLDSRKETTKESTELAELFFRLVVRAASKRSWSMAIYDVPPRSFAALLHRNRDKVLKFGTQQIKKDFDIVQKAMQSSARGGHPESQAPWAQFMLSVWNSCEFRDIPPCGSDMGSSSLVGALFSIFQASCKRHFFRKQMY